MPSLLLDARLDAAADAQRRERRRIARAAVRRIDARDPLGHRADDLHVLEPGAAVLGGDVVAAQVVDEPAERAEERDAVEVLRRPDDDALAAAVRRAPPAPPCTSCRARGAARRRSALSSVVVVDEAAAAERGARGACRGWRRWPCSPVALSSLKWTSP